MTHMEKRIELRQIYEIARKWDGIKGIILSHQGFLFSSTGNIKNADKLAALAPIIVSRVRKMLGRYVYLLIGLKDSTIFIYGDEEFTLLIQGEKNIMEKYIEPLTRLIYNNTIECPYCGAELDKKIAVCKRCGYKYPFTLPSCPNCGNVAIIKTCPYCKRKITYRGDKVRKDKKTLILFSLLGLFGLGLLYILHSPLAGVLNFIILMSLGIILYRITPNYQTGERTY